MSRLWGWIGLILLIVAVIISSISGAIVADPKRDNNTWHHVALYGSIMLAIIGIVLVLLGFRCPCEKAPSGYKNIIVPEIYARNILDDIKEYTQGGNKPCFARKNAGRSGGFFSGMFGGRSTGPAQPSEGNPFVQG